MKTYILTPSNKSAISAALARFCSPGKPGEQLIRKGFSQELFADSLAAWLSLPDARKFTKEQIAGGLTALSACNASAARQAMESLTISNPDPKEFAEMGGKTDKEGKPQELLLETYWKTLKPSAALVDTSKLGF
jgi:hypothetical protein